MPFVRFNQDDFPRTDRVAWRTDGAIEFRCGHGAFRADEISGAWFRKRPRPVAAGTDEAGFAQREAAALLDGIWETAPWFWVNRPAAIGRAEQKLLQLREARRLGFAVPATLVTNCPQAARAFARERPCVAKPLAGAGLSVGGIEHAIFTTAISPDDLGPDEDCASDGAVQACPAIFQQLVVKQFDLRVTVVGEQVFCARIVVRDRTAADVDWRGVNPARIRYAHHQLPTGLRARCVRLVASLGLAYGAFDFAVTAQDEHVFLELNPSGQWGWLERALELPIAAAIIDHLHEGRA